MSEGLHQVAFTCTRCGDGYIQTKQEPRYCPVCGGLFPVGHIDLIEFEIVELCSKPVPRNKAGTGGALSRDHFTRYDSLYTEHHSVDTVVPKLLLRARNEYGAIKYVYRLNCGYVGYRSAAVTHMVTMHGWKLQEARDALAAGVVRHDPEYRELDNPEHISVGQLVAAELGVA